MNTSRFKSAFIARRNKCIWKETTDSIKFYKLYKDGYMVSEIAMKYDVSEKYVDKLVRRRINVAIKRNSINDDDYKNRMLNMDKIREL